MEHEVLLEALSLKGTDWGVMADLLRHPPEAQILSATGDKFQHQRTDGERVLLCSDPLLDELKGLSQ